MKSMISALLLVASFALTACFANVTEIDRSERNQSQFESTGFVSPCYSDPDIRQSPARIYVDAMTCADFDKGFTNPPMTYAVSLKNAKDKEPEDTRTQREAYAQCVELSRNGMLMMQARQGGMSKARLISASDDPGFHEAVNAVYSVPRETSKQRQDEVANRFALNLLSECIESKG